VNRKVNRGTILKTLSLVYDSAGRWLVINLLTLTGRSLFPLAGLYLLKRLVETLTKSPETGQMAVITGVVWMIIALAIVLAADDLLLISGRYTLKVQSKKLEAYVMAQIHSQASTMGLKSFGEPSFHELLERAASDASWRPAAIVGNLFLLFRGILSFIIMAVVLSRFSILMSLILPMAFLPLFLSRSFTSKQLYKSRQQQTPLNRKASYFSWLITGERPAREIKLFGLGNYFMSLYNDYFMRSEEIDLRTLKQSSRYALIAAIFKTAALAGVIIILVNSMINGGITAGDLAIYIVASRQAMVYLRDAFSGLSGAREDKLFLNDYFEFIEQKSDLITLQPAVAAPESMNEIEIRDLSFTYQGSDTPALRNVSLTIREGERIAIVGDNGSGKSTLVKLLCRLYDPDAGYIKYAGTDVRYILPEEYRKRFSVVFQDFMLYYLSARENISISDFDHKADDENIGIAMARVGLDELFSTLPEGYDTALGHMTPEGRELSWGEWQKIAIARALFRRAPVLILDEPSSSLDAKAEYEIFSRLDSITEGRTTIFISHRLSNIMTADRIVVLSKGTVVECGTHEELMSQNGIYSGMYNRQKSMYR